MAVPIEVGIEPDPIARVPFRAVIASAAGVWIFYYILITLRSTVLDDDFFLEMFLRRGLVTLVGIAVTLFAWWFIRQCDGKPLAVRIAVALVFMIPAATLLAAVNQQAFASLEHKVVVSAMKRDIQLRHDMSGNVVLEIPDPQGVPREQLDTIQAKLDQAGMWKQLTDVAVGRYFLLVAWAALYFALSYAETARAAERREGEYRRAARSAELRSLRYQVNPHFLFNTLNSLSALVLTGKTAAAETMIQTISTFYRRSLAGDPTADVPLEEEIRLQQLYLQVEGVRFPDRLRTVIDVPRELASACIPGMLLQPLVENSVKYGVAPVARAVTITLAAREEHGRLVVTVSDDGPGAAEQGRRPADMDGCGIGLRNVRDRLAARFGAEASVVSGSTGAGYATIIRLPLVRHGC
ncbi:sensor histidine kinase [Novosphingobium tardum]|uniref:histidine kinase n=1 Tax=Novosphingobium tardum TaxID=1538021 RepID=A0ABV8RKQ9_9SPHN